MKKKVVSVLLSAAMVATLLAGCGGAGGSTAASSSAPAASEAAPAASEAAPAASEAAPASEAASTEAAEAAGAHAGDEDKLTGTEFEGLKANDAYNFAVVVKSFQSTYWQAAIKGMDMAAGELGVTYDAQGPNSESDIADQVNMLNSAITGGPAGIGLAACDTTSVLDSLQDAKDANVPVVCFDTGVADAPDGSVVATVATDNTQAGEVAAEHMYEAVKDVIANAEGQVRIGEVNQDATALNIQQRGLGFINKMIELVKADGKTVAVTGNEFYVNAAEGADGEEASADVIIEVAVPAQTTVELCTTEASTILSKEDCIAIFGSNQTSAEGLLAANSNLNLLGSDAAGGDVIGVGFDAGSVIKGAIADGTMYGAVTQSPLMMGYYMIYALTKAANGESVTDLPTDGYWYNAENMNDAEIAPNLYD